MAGQPHPDQQWYPLQSSSQEHQHLFPQPTAYKSRFSGPYAEVPHDETGGVSRRPQTFWQRWFGGTKRTLRAFTIVACIVLIINISWLFAAKAKYGIKNGFGTIRQGNCDSAKSLNTWLHFAINILSTLLLAGSNAFMAAFCCPSREEVDRAHRRGKSLQVGIFNFGNLRRIAKRKGLVVILLALTSVPFHLLYNSLVFTSLSTNQYYWSVVTEDFLSGSPFNLTGDWAVPSNGYPHVPAYPIFEASPPSTEFGSLYELDESGFAKLDQVMNDYFLNMQSSAPSWERLANKNCLEAYSNAFVSGRRNVVIVSSAKHDNNSILTYGSSDFQADMDGNWWICSKGGQQGGSQTCNARDYLSSANTWSVFDFPIEYCLSQKTEDTCSVQFSMMIMLVVVAFNAVKIALMIGILVFYDAEKILSSVGDAAQSFLNQEDPTTQMMCLANKRKMSRFWKGRGLATPFSRHRLTWGAAVSRKRWLFFFFLMLTSFFFVAFFGVWGFSHVKKQGVGLDPSSLWSLGFGELNQNTLVLYGGAGNPVTMTIIANIPQLFLSVIYFLYMGIVTSMFLAVDWSHFAFKPQTLMVSMPFGNQRGSWLLGAPLGWGIALLVVQTLLHWFLSQSLFVVELTVFDKDGKPYVYNPDITSRLQYTNFSNCGYSPIAIICSVVASGLLLLSAIILCWQRFLHGAPPVVGTCSAAISATCHPIEKRPEMVYGELRWGANGGFPNGVGHCALVPVEVWNAGRAGPPVQGGMYAGLPEEEPGLQDMKL